MSDESVLSVQFTLLYADSVIPTEQPYLQPLYGVASSVKSTMGTAERDNIGTPSPATVPDPSIEALTIGVQPVFGGAALGPVSLSSSTALTSSETCPASHLTLPNVGHKRYLDQHGAPLVSRIADDHDRSIALNLARPYCTPASRSGHVWHSVASRRSILLHGGLGETAFADTWEYTVDNGRWRELRCTAAPSFSTLPTPAFGQASSLYHNESGEVCLLLVGGIDEGDKCVSMVLSLNIDRQEWTPLQLSSDIPPCWGSTAQTLYQRRTPSPMTETFAPKTSSRYQEEEVVVLFGGMNDQQESPTTTFILHFDHLLTYEEVQQDPLKYLDNAEYDRREMEYIVNQEPPPGEVPSGDPDAVLEWRARQKQKFDAYVESELQRLVGKYWVEQIPGSDGTPSGRRRSCSAAYKKHFMFIFGGRDRHNFYNDLWVFNLPIRTWMHVRQEMPSYWLRQFFAQPYNRPNAWSLKEIREEIACAVRRSSLPIYGLDGVSQSQPNTDSLIKSRRNGPVEGRTGACMAIDPLTDRLFVMGGFAFIRSSFVHFGDVYAYHIRDHVWREVKPLEARHWNPRIDGRYHFIHPDQPLEHAKQKDSVAAFHATHRSMEEQLRAEAESYNGTYASTGVSAVQDGIDEKLGSGRAEVYPPIPLAPRNNRRFLLAEAGLENCPHVEWFALPVMIPWARTMAAIASDPVKPGSRYYFFGGRQNDTVLGDLFDVRFSELSASDLAYHQLQQELRLSQSGNPSHAAPSAARRAKVAELCRSNAVKAAMNESGRRRGPTLQSLVSRSVKSLLGVSDNSNLLFSSGEWMLSPIHTGRVVPITYRNRYTPLYEQSQSLRRVLEQWCASSRSLHSSAPTTSRLTILPPLNVSEDPSDSTKPLSSTSGDETRQSLASLWHALRSPMALLPSTVTEEVKQPVCPLFSFLLQPTQYEPIR
jgi:hypothetical protein